MSRLSLFVCLFVFFILVYPDRFGSFLFFWGDGFAYRVLFFLLHAGYSRLFVYSILCCVQLGLALFCLWRLWSSISGIKRVRLLVLVLVLVLLLQPLVLLLFV